MKTALCNKMRTCFSTHGNFHTRQAHCAVVFMRVLLPSSLKTLKGSTFASSRKKDVVSYAMEYCNVRGPIVTGAPEGQNDFNSY